MSSSIKNPSDKAPRASRAEASVWIVRLYSEERTPELEEGFRDWLNAHPENARQFEHITDVWELGGAVSTEGLPRMRSWDYAESRQKLTLAFVGAAACALIAAVAIGWWTAATYVTHHGEQRLVLLDDGSRVHLNSDSRLHIQQFDAHRRCVKLERGEAFFEIAKDSARPFVVQIGERQIAVLGTTFVARYEASETVITLVEGKVAVSPLDPSSKARLFEVQDKPAAQSSIESNPTTQNVTGAAGKMPAAATPAAESFMLSPGERLIFASLQPPKIDTPRIEAITAWRRGEVLLEAMPLSEAIAEMNRYDKRRLMLDDASLEKIRISGIYRSGDSLSFAQAVAELHGLEVQDAADGIHLQPLQRMNSPAR